MDFESPVKIFNKYAFYPNINKFKKNFFTQKANIYYGSTVNHKIKSKSPLENEMKEFIYCCKNKKKPKTSIKIADNVMRVLKKLN